MCYQYQMLVQKLKRFKFPLWKNYEFNHTIIVDIVYLDGKLVLQVADAFKNFGVAKFLKDMTTNTFWDT